MDPAGLPDGPDAGPRKGRRSTAARGPRGGTTRDGAAHSERVCVIPATPAAASDAAESAAVAEAADRQQAEYFLSLLIQRRRLADRRIEEYRKSVAAAEANGEAECAAGHRRMLHAEELDRQTLDGMIAKLQRRFPRQAAGNAPAGAQVRLAAR